MGTHWHRVRVGLVPVTSAGFALREVTAEGSAGAAEPESEDALDSAGTRTEVGTGSNTSEVGTVVALPVPCQDSSATYRRTRKQVWN